MQLVICRGIPASGKSTFARAWVLAGKDRVRINRDDIRMQLFGVEFGCDEVAVTKVEDAMIAAALKAGKSVVVDDTNIQHKYVRRIADIGFAAGAQVEVKEFILPLDEALKRNAARDRKVPEDVIRDMDRRLKVSGGINLDREPMEPYVEDDTLPRAILVDIDGTLAEMNGRSPYEWHRVGEDAIVEVVNDLVWAYKKTYPYVQVIVMSGRDGSCRVETTDWLEAYIVPFDELHMRAPGDQRKDSIVKYELFNEHVRGKYNVDFVLDDRQQVVDMWRGLGLRVFQVAEGDF